MTDEHAVQEYIQERLGHGSIPVTMDINGHVLMANRTVVESIRNLEATKG